ncbi:iron ABC transporter permease [Candidatus Albibeggiatoa sp. nov. NOAA]|uniref:ABC transporter permease n=1 Tax=Candidatus Albibeggiatoa sp. nov. NOAA TaxID=3162724 RepID=UPI0032F12F5F|nr:iron ABC transporter permease [Thiotrichaceae bacterium]
MSYLQKWSCVIKSLRFSPWQLAIIIIAFLFALPLLTVFSFVFEPVNDNWQHLVNTVLSRYVNNSLWLMLGVAVGSLIIGVSSAWLTSMCEFPGRKWFEWSLLLPLAMPAYIIAYTYTGLLDFAGPVQTTIRDTFGWRYGDYWFPEIRSLGGAITMLSLVLYPYIYLLARAAFLQQSTCVLEVSRSLGNGAWRTFFQVALPLARPAIIAGLSLVLMETLADYGTVQYFGVDTFTTGIFRTWFGLDDVSTAAQLAALLMVFVFALILLERGSRRQARYDHTSNRHGELPRYQLHGIKALIAWFSCFLPLFLGFLLPSGQLSVWAWQTYEHMVDAQFLQLVTNTLLLAGLTAFIALLLALFMAYGKRLYPVWLVRSAVRLAALGYAVPGTVIAVGVIIPLAVIDNSIDGWFRAYFNMSTGLLFSGTLVALVFAYLVRFLAVSIQTVEAGLDKIKPSMGEAARSLGYRPSEILRRIHIPILRGSLLTAILLVFVDVMKELPATLILRPFNFNTLAVRAYELASDERLADASTAALAIVLAGIIPVILLSISIAQSRKRHE